MRIYIKGMEMPETCWECIDKYRLVHAVKCTIYDKLYRYRHRLININNPILREKRAEDCPLVEVHTPHGDLIDKKKIMFELGESTMTKSNRDFCIRVLEAKSLTPVIIEAED